MYKVDYISLIVLSEENVREKNPEALLGQNILEIFQWCCTLMKFPGIFQSTRFSYNF